MCLCFGSYQFGLVVVWGELVAVAISVLTAQHTTHLQTLVHTHSTRHTTHHQLSNARRTTLLLSITPTLSLIKGSLSGC